MRNLFIAILLAVTVAAPALADNDFDLPDIIGPRLVDLQRCWHKHDAPPEPLPERQTSSAPSFEPLPAFTPATPAPASAPACPATDPGEDAIPVVEGRG